MTGVKSKRSQCNWIHIEWFHRCIPNSVR